MPKKSSTSERDPHRDLDIEISFIEGVVRRDPDYIDALQILGDNYTRRGRYVDGLKVDQILARLQPADPLVHYNLACSYSLTLQTEQCFRVLDKAIDLGYSDFRWISRDPDLANLRRSGFYKKLRAKIRALQPKAV